MADANGFETSLYQQVGKQIQTLRLKAGKSQAALGEAVSLARTSITNIEKGRQHLLLHTLYRIAASLNVSPRELLPPDNLSADGQGEVRVPKGLKKKDRDTIRAVVTKARIGR